MKFTKHVALMVSTVLMAMTSVYAADDHKSHNHDDRKGGEHAHDAKPLYGGVVTVVKDVNYELVATPDSMTLYVNDHGKPVDTKDGLATLTLLSASGKSEIKLAPADENTLQAKGNFKLQPGTKAAGAVQVDGKSNNVKFTLK